MQLTRLLGPSAIVPMGQKFAASSKFTRLLTELHLSGHATSFRYPSKGTQWVACDSLPQTQAIAVARNLPDFDWFVGSNRI